MPNKTESKSAVDITDAALIGEEDFEEEQLLKQAILHLNGNILGIVLGTVTGLIILVATNWLVIKGGEDVGTHLALCRRQTSFRRNLRPLANYAFPRF
jgi:hypothetical protein